MQILTNELARIQTKFNHPEATVPTSIQSQCEGFNTDVNILIGPGSENTCLRGGGGVGWEGVADNTGADQSERTCYKRNFNFLASLCS